MAMDSRARRSRRYKHRRTKTTYRRRMKGGAIDCEAEGFTLAIREATFGRDYPDAIVSHEDSETWTFEALVDISTRGLVGWYCKQAGLTSEECKAITSMPEVQILGAFFHRYKVFSEHIATTKGVLRRGLMPPAKRDWLYTKLSKHPDSTRSDAMKFVESYVLGNARHLEFQTVDVPIEQAIDRAQCLLWVIVKNKRLPDGFKMDPRIEERARNPILLKPISVGPVPSWPVPDLIRGVEVSPVLGIMTIANVIAKAETENRELREPPLTLGVY